MPTITLSQLQGYVLDRLEQNTSLYPIADITNAINEFYRIANAFIGLNQKLVSVPGFSVKNRLIYQIPSPILFPINIFFEGTELDKISLLALARNHPRWATTTTAKAGKVQRWAPIGITQFVIHPIDAIGGRDIAVQGVVEPTPLLNANDPLQLDDEFLDMAVSYAAHRLQLREGGRPFSSSMLLMTRFYSLLRDRVIKRGADFPNYSALLGVSK